MQISPRVSLSGEIRRVGAGGAFEADHSHPELEYNLILRGRGSYVVTDGHLDLSPGTLVWLLPGQQHRLMRSPDLDMWVVCAHPGSWNEALLADIRRHPAKILAGDDALALDRLLAHVAHDSEAPALYNAGLAYALHSAHHASIVAPGKPREAMSPVVLKALLLVRSDAATATIRDLAKRCGVSPDYLGRLLVQQTGWGFVEWRNRARLERFHVVYPDSSDLLTAALAAGFGSYTQFHRVFLELIGCTPGDWARNGTSTNMSLPAVVAHGGDSARMSWYNLAELSLPSAGRWLDGAFAARLQCSETIWPNEPPTSLPYLRTVPRNIVKDRIVAEVAATDPGSSAQLAQAFAEHDIVGSFATIAGHYGFDAQDLCDIVAGYVAIAWLAANCAVDPDVKRMQALRARVGVALAFARPTDNDERQEIATALICQAMFLRNALLSARASGDSRMIERVSAAARKTAFASFQLDLALNIF